MKENRCIIMNESAIIDSNDVITRAVQVLLSHVYENGKFPFDFMIRTGKGPRGEDYAIYLEFENKEKMKTEDDAPHSS